MSVLTASGERSYGRTMNAIVATTVSMVSGLFTASWGAYKDAPLEGFKHRSFWRSIAFSVAILGVLRALGSSPAGMFRLFFVIMGIERLAIEIYKPCFRKEDHGKYFIPQNMSFLGLDLAGRATKIAVGLALVAGALGVLVIPTVIASWPAHFVVAVGVGMFICCGGAAKDAPFEGFDRRKFLRSAIVLAVTSPLVYRLGPAPLGTLVFMNGGIERLIVESYKTYVSTKPPGKFRRGQPLHDPGFVRYRPVLRAIAGAIMFAVVAAYVAS